MKWLVALARAVGKSASATLYDNSSASNTSSGTRPFGRAEGHMSQITDRFSEETFCVNDESAANEII